MCLHSVGGQGHKVLLYFHLVKVLRSSSVQPDLYVFHVDSFVVHHVR